MSNTLPVADDDAILNFIFSKDKGVAFQPAEKNVVNTTNNRLKAIKKAEQGDFKTAQALFEKLMKQNDNDAAVYNDRAQMYRMCEQYENATSDLEKALDLVQSQLCLLNATKPIDQWDEEEWQKEVVNKIDKEKDSGERLILIGLLAKICFQRYAVLKRKPENQAMALANLKLARAIDAKINAEKNQENYYSKLCHVAVTEMMRSAIEPNDK
mmetsp:Transcript_9603/g.14462  ORF Transcript_9603/g.14462 Transcript_9603/m.14462 type:complete len:212 (+) Transcript_9603:17-652(+)